ncbi:complement C1q tumor necrosis factor-related protein 6-like [Mytilus trossulus]|uniref:complement C1q tumor necrosis factor-related protein 6-like n=1 Tax=Mytilus trossulus TaxID=6551 RepID=UPI00300653F5
MQTIQKEKEPVMFYAVIRGKTFTYNIDTILVFETVIVNEGGHYDKYDGVFVAPRKATYMFSWTVSGTGATYTVTEFVVENKVISSAGEYHGGGTYSSGSMTALCEMEKGDHAWIRSTGVSTEHNLYSHDNYPQSSFLGFLLLTE